MVHAMRGAEHLVTEPRTEGFPVRYRSFAKAYVLADLGAVILYRTPMPVILLPGLWPNVHLLGKVFDDTARHLSRLTGKTPFMLKKLQEDDKAQPCRSIFVADPLLLLRQDRPLFGSFVGVPCTLHHPLPL